MVIVGIASKRGVLPKLISKSSTKAPTFLVHGFVISKREERIQVLISIMDASTSASIILCADTDDHER